MSVRDNTTTVLSDVARKANVALRFVLDDIDKTSERRTPKDKGDLRRNKLKQVLRLHGIIQWRQRYAAPQEDVQHKRYTTPGTGPHFAENAVRDVVRRSEQHFRRAGL